MSGKKKRKGMFVFICIFVFAASLAVGVVSKLTTEPSCMKKYNVEWSDKIGTLKNDLSYADGEENKFDLYLPQDNTKESYGLVIYIHGGGFSAGDKEDNKESLAWLCSKGYVAAGINYTLATDDNDVTVLSQSNEIKAAVPEVVKAAESAGYHIDKMATAGESAGHALAMIYAYRDGKGAPVPVVFTYGAVGPSSFVAEDWDILDTNESAENNPFNLIESQTMLGTQIKETDTNLTVGANLFSFMSGTEITTEEITSGSYLEKARSTSPAEWVSNNPVPSVVVYGTYDKVQPFLSSRRLESALKENDVDYQYFVAEHSGHAIQNDNDIHLKWMEAVEEYLDKYMPVR